MRENVKSVGLVLALIVAGISLPTSIISLGNRATIINNYYDYEENYYGNNETEIDYTKPLEIYEFTNLSLDEYFADLVYNMSSENTIFIMSNETNPSFTISYVIDSMVDYFYAGYPCFIDGNQPNQAKWWSPPNYNTWHVIFKNDADLESVKVYIEIL